MTTPVASRPFDRRRSLEALRDEHFDVVVVGGGITGVGVALDAASRGLRTALIERGDFASGTSSRSSKLIHGGIRYLQQKDFTLVHEALRERHILRRNAPHLVAIQPFLLPVMGSKGVIPKKLSRVLGTAMWMYDLFGGWRIGKRHRRISAAAAAQASPILNPSVLGPSYVYYDCAADDARLVVNIARTAALGFGAVAANRVEAVGLRRSEAGYIDGVTVTAGGEEFTIATRSVVNAAGIWADDVRALGEYQHPHSLTPAKGIHVVVPADRLPGTIGVIIPVRNDRRSVFVLPRGKYAYIGTTDTAYDGPLDDPQCDASDVDYLLSAVNAVTGLDLSVDDVTGTWAGLRPLVAGAKARTADLSRRHQVVTTTAGMVTVVGGKLTTYRQMAEDAVDAVLDGPLRGTDVGGKCRTRHLPLRGANGHEHAAAAIAADAARYGVTLPAAHCEHLVGRYGTEAAAVVNLLGENPAWAAPLVDGMDYLQVEAVWSVRNEMAATLEDIFERRTRAALFDVEKCEAAVDAVAQLIGPELGWSASEQSDAAASYAATLAARRPTALAANAPAGGTLAASQEAHV